MRYCHISQSDCPAEILRTYKNAVLYPPDPPFLLQLKGGLGTRLVSPQPQPNTQRIENISEFIQTLTTANVVLMC